MGYDHVDIDFQIVRMIGIVLLRAMCQTQPRG